MFPGLLTTLYYANKDERSLDVLSSTKHDWFKRKKFKQAYGVLKRPSLKRPQKALTSKPSKLELLGTARRRKEGERWQIPLKAQTGNVIFLQFLRMPVQVRAFKITES